MNLVKEMLLPEGRMLEDDAPNGANSWDFSWNQEMYERYQPLLQDIAERTE